jgi:hypothetical protein
MPMVCAGPPDTSSRTAESKQAAPCSSLRKPTPGWSAADSPNDAAQAPQLSTPTGNGAVPAMVLANASANVMPAA